ncbi:MAG: archaeosine synthase subunit alpha [Methanoculleaceae archaeon]
MNRPGESDIFEVTVRDGLARTGRYTRRGRRITTPAVIDAEEFFPDLFRRPVSNLPLIADADEAARYLVRGSDQPVAVHPAVPPTAVSGDTVMPGCWHTALSDPHAYVRWLCALKKQIPPDVAWYAPYAALPANLCLLVYSGFDCFDTGAVDLRSSQHIFCTIDGEFDADMMDEGVCNCAGCRAGDLRLHNRLALAAEAANLRQAIISGTIREIFESRCRSDPAQVAILRLLDQEPDLLEPNLPVARAGPLRTTTAEALTRPDIRRFAERVAERFTPTRTDVTVLLPCSARKPYSHSQTHHAFISAIDRRAQELIVTSPLGPVPRELEGVYPAAHYDVPVTGYWDREEVAILASDLARYFTAHGCKRVIAHLDGGALEVAVSAADTAGIELERTCVDRPTAPASLRALREALEGYRRKHPDTVRGIASWQFGVEITTDDLRIRGRGMEKKVMRGGTQLFSIDPVTGLLRPTLEGWREISGYRVVIDDFVPRGDILAPGVVDADPAIRPGDEVLVLGPSALATGRAVMGADEMVKSNRGVAVRVRRTVRR